MREHTQKRVEQRLDGPPVPVPGGAPPAARVLALQRTAGNRAVGAMLARQEAPAAAPPAATLEEVLQWPEQMPRADRQGRTPLTVTLTPGGKAEPALAGVTDVAGTGVTEAHRAWARFIERERAGTPVAKLGLQREQGGWVYNGRGATDADPTQLRDAPDQADAKVKAQWSVWREMKHEGGASAINAWDQMMLTWGRGHAAGSGGKQVGELQRVMPLLVADADVARELKRFGVFWERGVWLAVNTRTASVEVGTSALSLIQGSREILAALIAIAEDKDPAHGNLHQKIVDAQWQAMARHHAGDVPDFALGRDDAAPNGKAPWPEEVIQLVAHMTWGTPALGWGVNRDAYRRTGGDIGRILLLWAELRAKLWPDKQVTNGAFLVNATQPMTEFRAWGRGVAARFLGMSASGPIDMTRDVARKDPALSGRLVLKNAFGDGYFVYPAVSAEEQKRLGGNARLETLRWLNGQSMRRLVAELRELRKKGEGAFLYNWLGPDARAAAEAGGLDAPRLWFAMESVRQGRPATGEAGYAALPDAQKAVVHDLFKVKRPEALKDTDASAE